MRNALNALTVSDFYTNVASQIAEGWDYGARYRHSLLGGEASVVLNLVQYTEQQFQLLPTFAPTDTNGLIGSPEMAGDLTFNYEQGPWNFRYGVTWVQGMSDYASLGQDPETSIHILATPDYYLHNTSVQYEAETWRLTAGIRNLFDEEPPPVSAADFQINGIGSVPILSGFDYFGRQFFVNLSARF